MGKEKKKKKIETKFILLGPIFLFFKMGFSWERKKKAPETQDFFQLQIRLFLFFLVTISIPQSFRKQNIASKWIFCVDLIILVITVPVNESKMGLGKGPTIFRFPWFYKRIIVLATSKLPQTNFPGFLICYHFFISLLNFKTISPRPCSIDLLHKIISLLT